MSSANLDQWTETRQRLNSLEFGLQSRVDDLSVRITGLEQMMLQQRQQLKDMRMQKFYFLTLTLATTGGVYYLSRSQKSAEVDTRADRVSSTDNA